MAANKIKGLTIAINGETTGLDKALSGVNTQSKNLQTELKEVERLLKLDPTNTELLAQKQKLLSDSVSTTKDKLNTLKTAAEQAQEQLEKGEISEGQFRALQREIVKTEDSLKGLEDAAKSSNTELSKISATADNVSKSAGKVADVTKGISTVAAGGVAGLAAMAINAGKAADDLNTLSKQSGFSTEEIQKWQYASDVVDVSTDSIITAAQKMKKNMVSTSADTTAAWQTLGVSVRDDVTGELRDSNTVFYEVLDSLSKVPNETERDTLAMQLFGKSADELAGIVDDGGAALQQMGQDAEDAGLILSQDALDGANAFNDGLDTVKAKASQAFMSAGASLAENLLPALDNLVDKLSGVLQWIASLDGDQLRMIGTILLVVAAISPLASIVSKVASLISFVSGTVIPALSSAFAFLAANPIVLVIAAIAALVAGIVILWNKNEDFRNFVIKIWTTIKDTVGDIIGGIKKFFTEIIPSAIDTMVTFFTNLPGRIWDELTKAINKIKQWGADIKEWAEKKLPAPIATIVGFFAELPGNLLTIGKNMLEGLWNGIKEKSEWVKSQVTGFVGTIKGWFTGKDGFDTHSPSKWSALVGNNVTQGLANGILALKDKAIAAAKTVVGATQKVFDGIAYDPNIDYMSYMERAKEAGNFDLAASIEKMRNAKIDGEGLSWEKTFDFSGLSSALSGLADSAAYATSPTETYAYEDSTSKEELFQMIGEALLSGLTEVGDKIFDAIPKQLDFLLNGNQLAKTSWDNFDLEGKRKGRIFAPTREQIASIAMSVMPKLT